MKLSKCNGTKKALLIGVNYGPKDGLNAVADTVELNLDLGTYFGFKDHNIKDLERATRNDILSGIRWLVRNASEDDSLFILFSGHGGYSESRGEPYIYPSDGNRIYQSELFEKLVEPLPERCRLTAVFDCCHAENMLGLRYNYTSPRALRDENPDTDGSRCDAEVLCFAGCASNKSSYDEKYTIFKVGALTQAFTYSVRNASYYTVFNDTCNFETIKRQSPRLSSSYRLDPNRKFIL